MNLYSDGGARGNPGPAAIAFLAKNEVGQTVKEDTCYIGIRTNNQAEYEALLLALKFAIEADASEVTCHLDSELVVKQLNGEYAVKNDELHQLWRKVQQQKGCFRKISFVNVRRSHPQIQRADALVNETLDLQAKHKNNSSFKVESSEKPSMFVHASIRTGNMQRAIDFYSKFLGLVVQSRHDLKATNSQIVFMQDAAHKGCTLELTWYRDQKEFMQAEYEKRLFDHLGFEVADINKTLDAMRKAGVTISDEPTKFNECTTIAFVEDPDGTLVELIERK